MGLMSLARDAHCKRAQKAALRVATGVVIVFEVAATRLLHILRTP
jgi:hypothetical protein